MRNRPFKRGSPSPAGGRGGWGVRVEGQFNQATSAAQRSARLSSPVSQRSQPAPSTPNPFSPVKARGRRGAAFSCGGNRQIVERLSQPLLGASRPVSGRRGIGNRKLRIRNHPFHRGSPSPAGGRGGWGVRVERLQFSTATSPLLYREFSQAASWSL